MAGKKTTSVIETVIVMNGESAKRVIESIKNELKVLKAEAEQIRLTDPNSKELDNKLNQIKNLTQAVRQSASQAEKIDKVYNNLGNATLRQLKSALTACKNEMQKMSEASLPQAEELRKKYAAIQEQIRKFSLETPQQMKSAGNAMTNTINGIMRKMAVYAGVGAIKGQMREVYQGSLEMSDQLANIRKVSGLSIEEVNTLNKNIAKIDTRTSIQELNELAYAGAKLGMGDYGVKGLESYVEAANEINSALKEEMGVEAMTSLSKIGEVMGLFTDKNNIGGPLKQMGSAIYSLASFSTSTGQAIVDFSARLTGMAKSAHVTTDELLGLASASDAMYLMPEVSSTAFSKFMTALQTQYNIIEKKLSIPKGTLKNMLEQGKTMDAMLTTLEAMKKKGNMNALNPVFKDLGSDGARIKGVLTTMSQNVDMLREHIDVSKQAFLEGTAVTKEYNIQNETAQAILSRANNMWNKAFVNPESIKIVKEMVQVWYDFSKAMTSSNTVMNTAKFLLKTVVYFLQGVVKMIPFITGFLLTTVARTSVIPKITQGINSLSGAWKKWRSSMEVTRQTLAFTDEQLKTLKATTGAVGTAATRTATASTFLRIQSWAGAKAAKVLTVSLMGVRAALRGILGSIGIGLIFEAVSWIMSLLSKTKEAKEEIKKLDTNIAGATAQAGNAVREMSTLRDAINKAPDHSNQKIALMAQFNKNYGTYIKGLNLETKAVLTQADAYKKLASALRGKIYTEMEEEDTNNFLKPEMSEAANRWTKYQIAYENAKKKHGNTSLIGEYALLDGSHLRGIVMDEMKKGASVESVMKKVNDSIGSADGLKWMDLLFDGKSGQEMLKSYIRAEFRAENTRRFIAKKYSADDVKKDKANYTLATTPRETMNDARDKEAEREANSAEQTRKRKLKEVVKESDAVIDKIKSYYTRQKTYLNEMFNRGVLEKAQLEQYTSQMEDRQNKTLAVARKAIAKGHTGEWDRYKMTEMGFGQDMFDTSTENLLDDIRHTNVWNIHNRFRRLKGQSELDAIEKNAEKNMAEIAKKETERQQEAAKEIQEYDYTVQVDNKFEKEMVSKGIIKLSMKEALNEYVDMGRDFSKNGTEMMMKPGPMTAMLANARENETAIYGLDMRDISDRDSFMKTMFAGKSYNKFFQEVRELDINNPKDEGKITVFYNHIVDYLDAYTEAQKKETERDRKIFSYKYKRTDAYKENQQEERVLEGEKKLAGITTSLGMTTSEYSQDMELEMLKAKLEAAQDYYSFLAQSKADQMLLEEQQQKINEAGMNLYQKQMEQIQTSLSKLKNWMNPVEKAGEDLGKAVFGSLQDRRNVFVNLMQQYADLTREMILNWVKQRLQQKIHNRLMETNESQHEMSMQTIQKAGDMAKLQMEQTTNTASETAQATHATKTITTEAAETSGKVQLGIVGAAATTLKDLGWWGIPLVAVITALLNAMLAAAMSGVSKLFGGGATASATANTTKITSGMLTYDEGNVQAFAANDGNVYRATPVSHLSTALVTSPIATSVNGQPSLVAEKGPEIVIGRQTTRAMMMNDPALVRTIINYDRYHSGRYRALDNGEIPVEWGQGKENGSIDNTQLIQAITTLNTILANGISAKINKYGAGGLVEEVADGLNFARRNRMNRNVNRLFK